ncbi:cytidylate kinase [Gigaspora margarita]|uniref:(d)CMP kinase n=1 Tax=Gigaspora margarita TaxID=4874 RepID=A0A8H3X528_GIGMA|nr:cytidylate kinase [Gigaspora margarita]
MKNGGYVVVGRDATINILLNAKFKLVFEADFETRVYKRNKQLNVEEFEAIGKVFSDLLKRDMDSFNLVLETRKVATIIDTTDLSIEQVELANYIADKAYAQLIVKLEERHKFMNYLKELYELQVTEYEKIEREVLPKNHSNNKKLFKDAQIWRKDILTKSKNATKFQASHLATKILGLEVEMDRQEQEQEEQEAKKQKINQKNENKYLIIF